MKDDRNSSRSMTKRVERLQSVADKLLGRIGEELSGTESPGEKRYKEIADTLKVIRDIQLIRPEGEEGEGTTATVEIEIRGGEEYEG